MKSHNYLIKNPKSSTYTHLTNKKALLDAVAIQDHYSKALKLQKLQPLSSVTKKRTLPKIKSKKGLRRKTNKKRKPLAKLNYKNFICEDIAKKEILETRQRELYLKKFRQNLTLAERRGLVPSRALPLQHQEWDQVISEAKQRLSKEESVCSICLGGFHCEEQVILSCSHYFHKKCLASYEKHSGQRKCPLCRATNYQTSNFYEGAKNYLNRQATRLQAALRMKFARDKFLERLVSENYVPKSKFLRQSILAFRLDKVTSEIYRHTDERNKKLGKIFKQMELDQQKQEDLMITYEQNAKKILQERNRRFGRIFDRMTEQKVAVEALEVDLMKEPRWRVAGLKASERGDKSCSICFQSLENKRPVYLTSCSHVFHGPCLSSLEKFSGDKKSCPLCRRRYEKFPFVNFKKIKEILG